MDKPKSYVKVGKLLVEDLDETIIECMQRWAFMDASAALYSNDGRIRLGRLLRQSYWRRIHGTDVRVGWALEYGCHLINRLTGKEMYRVREPKLKDEYVRRETKLISYAIRPIRASLVGRSGGVASP